MQAQTKKIHELTECVVCQPSAGCLAQRCGFNVVVRCVMWRRRLDNTALDHVRVLSEKQQQLDDRSALQTFASTTP